MTDSLTAEEHFRDAPDLAEGDIQAKLYSYTVAIVRDTTDGECISLSVYEARALRDWLNKVIP